MAKERITTSSGFWKADFNEDNKRGYWQDKEDELSNTLNDFDEPQ